MKSNQNFQKKTDCFAYNPDNDNCKAMSYLLCKEKDCSFYKEKSTVDMNKITKDIEHYNCSSKRV